MNRLFNTVIVGILLLLTGCASAPKQAPMPLSKDFYSAKAVKIGVAMSVLPKVDTAFPGANCLLCLGVASVANGSLTKHVQTLNHDDLAQLKTAVGNALSAKGYDVKIIDEPVDISAIPKSTKEGVNAAARDFSTFKTKYNIDKIFVAQFSTVGVNRNYASYVPTSDPKATINGLGYIVDTNTNVYDLYLPIDIQKSAGLDWDEPPKYAGLTTAFFQALESTKDLVLEALTK